MHHRSTPTPTPVPPARSARSDPRPGSRPAARRAARHRQPDRLFARAAFGALGIVVATAIAVPVSAVTTAAATDVSASSATAAPTQRPAATLQPSGPTASATPSASAGGFVDEVSTTTGSLSGGTVVTIEGAGLADVATVDFGGTPAQIVSTSDSAVTVTTPAAPELAETTVDVTLHNTSGEELPVQPTATTAAASPSSALAKTLLRAPSVTATPEVPRAFAATAFSFAYVVDPVVQAQLGYALAHWQDYNAGQYGAIPGNDCVNFTSQTLVARGWAMDADWWSSNTNGAVQWSPAWQSSTALAGYLAAHPERATALTDEQRDRVKVGDIVQFDWDDSGDRDHTGIVTKVERTDAGIQIYFAGHTSDTDYRSVDEAIHVLEPGASVFYWSIV
ncbi:amidase domain-containing protein [Compostimonas suwonensis]|uniref:IPT/TIG domain-containing protein n=1 Tax=Compostimonas suwonensis TaxID=1048394 RepID=A0A2M9C3Q7_9MICO|nr:amidase domain-containing protein [Compostimonas suwonensis]PJJ65119.1 IPT/TIG domain-containing protein [Compostimonas suwonensis]